MTDQKNQLTKLLQQSELSVAEMQWILSFLERTDDPALKQIIEQHFSTQPEHPGIPAEVSQKLLKKIYEKLELDSPKPASRIFYMKTLAWAASLIGIILISFVVIKNGTGKPIAKTGTTNKFKNDVSPGGNKATLRLADGSVIMLDETKNGILTQQGTANIIKIDGKLLYDITPEKINQVVYNTISTPKRGQYQLELSDGTLVWLNASSSIHFPTSFVGKERRVEITGEAYFEVAKDANKPFIVSVNSSEVQVLGTHFNINAYSDEDEVRTTLLEGSVKFVDGNNSSFLEPGQQSQLTKDRNVRVIKDVDVNGVVAWKNGQFNFDNAGIESIMRQLSRWYDVDIEYKGKTDDIFVAEMSRNIKLSDVLKALELTGRVKFEIEGNKIIVMP